MNLAHASRSRSEGLSSGSAGVVVTMLLLGGCSCLGSAEPAPPATPVLGPSEAPVSEGIAVDEPSDEPRAEPTPPTEDEARAWLARLGEARLLSRTDPAQAYPLFSALVLERPSNARLRCEAGFVASRAGLLDHAERDIRIALAGWARPPSRSMRNPLAMCLYNQGLVAHQREDDALAAAAWRESLELRPNRTVAAALAALGDVSSDEAGESEDDAEGCGRATILAGLTAPLGPEATIEVRDIAATPASPAAMIASVEYDEDDGPHCTNTTVFVQEGACMIELASASECLYWSYFDEHASIGEPAFFDGGPELGTVAVLERGVGGRGDSEGGGAIEGYQEGVLVVCAARRDWSCVEVPITQYAETDCRGSGGCFDPDDPETADLPVASVRGYSLTWQIEGSALRLTADDDSFTAPETPPQQGRIELRDLFE